MVAALAWIVLQAVVWSGVFTVSSAFRPVRQWGGLDRHTNLMQPPPQLRSSDRIHPHSTRLYGIPKLFRWLVDLYPVVLESVGEGLSNAMSVDNFYLDMNGIIHTCTHSNNDKLVPLKEQEMFLRIFAYTDRLYKLVSPRKKMFLAVDGVAPRAKMNQQRSRRFRSSKEREALIADHLAKEGSMPEDESFDSNCITPGTEFMYRLSLAFRKWIEYKMKTDRFWQTGAEVIFSGPDVPGEGEHKIMDLIREEQAKYPPDAPRNDRHCLYGLDADLIMLSLVTHEPHFVLLREKVLNRRDPGAIKKSVLEYTEEDFECLEITILRRMLKTHYRKLSGEIDKRAEGGGGVEVGALGSDEGGSGSAAASTAHSTAGTERVSAPPPLPHKATKGAITTKTAADTVQFPPSVTKQVRWESGFDLERVIDDFVFMCFFVGNDFLPCLPHMDIADGSLNMMMNTYRDLLPSLGGYLTHKNAIHRPRLELFLQELARREPLYFEQRGADEQEPEFAGPGYRDHYYLTKFGIQPGDQAAIRALVQSYLEGLYWVLTYYHKGCGSWTWYYPYLYAPLASDLVDLASIEVKFEAGKPFTPLLQLLSVLPPQSGAFLPPSYEAIMTDPQSPMVDYYPQDFEVDANGKRNAWECIVRIPFINETVLLDAVSRIDHQASLTDAERARNAPGIIHRFQPKTPRTPGTEVASPTSGGAVNGGGVGNSREGAGSTHSKGTATSASASAGTESRSDNAANDGAQKQKRSWGNALLSDGSVRRSRSAPPSRRTAGQLKK